MSNSTSASLAAYRLGTPIETGAVVGDCPKHQPLSALKGWRFETSGTLTSLTLDLAENDRVFGLGENVGRVDKRGQRYRLFARDEGLHTPDKKSLYGSHPFLIISGARTSGVFIDSPGEILVDAAYTDRTKLTITVSSADFDLYTFGGTGVREVVASFLRLCGAPVVPPRWAFGYQQCRYSYPDEKSVRAIAEGLDRHDIPCDVLYMDIDYMDGYRCFTVDKKKFPDLPKMAADLAESGIKIVVIIDPGIKVDPGYAVYESGVAGGHFCRAKDGELFAGAVWPGMCHFPDFFNRECREWWGELYRGLLDQGITGFWNDMNEPAIFYTVDGATALKNKVAKLDPVKDDGDAAIAFISTVGSYWASEEYYKDFEHRLDNGKSVPHTAVHSLYGTMMARATYDGLRKLRPNQRHFVMSRSSYPGMHRYAVIWTGDNHSWWEHLHLHMQMMISLGLVGIFYTGADIGGFNADASPELVTRWTQLGVFSPLFRNHSVKHSRQQEPWEFGEKPLAIMRDAIRLRYALLGYMYSQYRLSVENLSPFIAPLLLDYDDEISLQTDDQFFVGDALMAAPVHVANTNGRFVHLPRGLWLKWIANGAESRNFEVVKAGQRYEHAALDQIPMYLRENRLIFLNAVARASEHIDYTKIEVIGLVTDQAETTFVWDDGNTPAIEKGETSRLTISVKRDGTAYKYGLSRADHSACPLPVKQVTFEIYDEQGKEHRHTLSV